MSAGMLLTLDHDLDLALFEHFIRYEPLEVSGSCCCSISAWRIWHPKLHDDAEFESCIGIEGTFVWSLSLLHQGGVGVGMASPSICSKSLWICRCHRANGIDRQEGVASDHMEGWSKHGAHFGRVQGYHRGLEQTPIEIQTDVYNMYMIYVYIHTDFWTASNSRQFLTNQLIQSVDLRIFALRTV